jgi:hypothetical protein
LSPSAIELRPISGRLVILRRSLNRRLIY